MAQLPADRTKLALAQSNQVPSAVASSQRNKDAITEAYDTIDMLHGFAQTQLGLRYSKAETDALLLANKTGDHTGTWQGYTPSQASASIVQQNLDALKADVTQREINAKSDPYNVKGDGVTDDTSRILLGLSTIAVGETFILPKGEYVISGTITLPAGKHWKMMPGAILYPTGNFDVFVYSGGGSVIDGLYISCIRVPANSFTKTILSIPIKGNISAGRIQNVDLAKNLETAETASVGIGFTHDPVTARNTDHVVYPMFRNIRVSGTYYGILGKVTTTINGDSPWATSVHFSDVQLIWCRRSIHLEAQNTAALGLLASWLFNNVTFQTHQSTDYHIKLSGVTSNRITNIYMWDWSLANADGTKRPIVIERSSRNNFIQTHRAGSDVQYEDADCRFRNTIQVVDDPKNNMNDRAAVVTTVPKVINSKVSGSHYAGHQDNSLAFADKRYTVSAYEIGTLAPITVVGFNNAFNMANNGTAVLQNVQGKTIAIEIDMTIAKAKDALSSSDGLFTTLGISYQLGTGGTKPPTTNLEAYTIAGGVWASTLSPAFADFYITESPTVEAGSNVLEDAHVWMVNKITITGIKIRFVISNITTTNITVKHIFGLDTRRRGYAYLSSGDGGSVFGDVFFEDNTKGPTVRSPDGSYWRIKVDNAGAITTIKLS